MPIRAMLVAAVLLMLSASATVSILDDHTQIQELWRLPLGISPLPLQLIFTTLVVETDESNIYAADGRGIIFAVEASSGQLLWSNPGMDGVVGLQCFPQIPDIVYLFQNLPENPALFTLYALRKTDGTILSMVQNLTQLQIAPTANGTKIALPYQHGIQLMDTTLSTVYWTIRGGPDWNAGYENASGISYWHLTATDDMVASVRHNGSHLLTDLQVFDTVTGKLRCQLDNTSVSPNNPSLLYYNVPFSLDEQGRVVVWYNQEVEPQVLSSYPRVGDLDSCTSYETERVNPWALEAGAISVILPLHPNSSSKSNGVLFFGLSRVLLNSTTAGLTWGDWVITHSQLGSNETLWNLTFAAPPTTGSPEGSPAPTILNVPGRPDRVQVFNNGFLSEVDVNSGKVVWNFTSQLPYAPQLFTFTPIAFPIGDPLTSSVLFVPNLLGYTLIDAASDQVITRNLDTQDPIIATISFLVDARNPQRSGHRIVICVTISGALVAYG